MYAPLRWCFVLFAGCLLFAGLGPQRAEARVKPDPSKVAGTIKSISDDGTKLVVRVGAKTKKRDEATVDFTLTAKTKIEYEAGIEKEEQRLLIGYHVVVTRDLEGNLQEAVALQVTKAAPATKKKANKKT